MRYIRCMRLVCCIPLLAACASPLSVQRFEGNGEHVQDSGIRQAKPSLCVVITSDGPPGQDTWLTITESGEVRFADSLTETSEGEFVSEEEQPPHITQATQEQLDTLKQAVTSAEWQQLDEQYGTPTVDDPEQHVVCGGKGIDVHAGAELPAVLNDVLQQLDALRQQALQQ